MSYDPLKHHRRSIRLRPYNYAWAGVYFVTIIVRGRECLFGEIKNGEVCLNEAGHMVQESWLDLPTRFSFCECGDWVVMPNHFHGILIFDSSASTPSTQTSGTANASLGRVIQAFKSITTNTYIQGAKEKGWSPFEGKLWLRNYWERIIRDEKEWSLASDYIWNNPVQWESDKQNPENNTALRSHRNSL